jgi:hypothetical protein
MPPRRNQNLPVLSGIYIDLKCVIGVGVGVCVGIVGVSMELPRVVSKSSTK